MIRALILAGLMLSCALPSEAAAQRRLPDWAEPLRPFFWEGARIEADFARSHLLTLDLEGGAIGAVRLHALLRRLALEQAAVDRVLLLQLSIRNGRVIGALELDGFTLPFALRFENLEIPEIRFRRMRFERQLSMVDVEVLRKVHVGRSHFLDGWSVTGTGGGAGRNRREASFRALPAGEMRNPLADPAIAFAFRIDKSEIENDLVIAGVRMRAGLALANTRIRPSLRIVDSLFDGRVEIRDNQIDNLDLYTSTINARLWVDANEMERIEIKRAAMFGPFEITRNVLTDYLVVGGAIFAPAGGVDGLQLEENEVHKHFALSAEYVSPMIDTFSLVGNDVRGPAVITLPDERVSSTTGDGESSGLRRFRLDLQNARFAGDLRLAMQGEGSLDACGDGDADDPACAGERYCFETHAMPADRLLEVDLRNVEVGRLDWDLPVGDCRYQWDGEGFRYANFEGGVEAQERWIAQILAPSPGPIIFTAERLRDAGKFETSRDLMFQAKRMNYEPRRCGVGSETAGDDDVCRPYATCTFEAWPLSADSCFRQYLLYLYLYSSGFGVKPEYAGACLIGTWLLGLAVYYPYTALRRRESEDGEGRTADGLEEAQASFADGGAEAAADTGDRDGLPPAGFALYQPKEPRNFSLTWFSLDATLPVIDLHAYNTYYPTSGVIRVVSFIQHILGWIFVTSLLASLAVL